MYYLLVVAVLWFWCREEFRLGGRLLSSGVVRVHQGGSRH